MTTLGDAPTDKAAQRARTSLSPAVFLGTLILDGLFDPAPKAAGPAGQVRGALTGVGEADRDLFYWGTWPSCSHVRSGARS